MSRHHFQVPAQTCVKRVHVQSTAPSSWTPRPLAHFDCKGRNNIAIKMLAAGVTHRDIKLENTLIGGTKPGTLVKICDFGYSKRPEVEMSQCKSVVGTPAYLAPEVRLQDAAYIACKRRTPCWRMPVSCKNSAVLRPRTSRPMCAITNAQTASKMLDYAAFF